MKHFRLTITVTGTALLLATPTIQAAPQAGHGGDITIDPAAVSETRRLGDRSYSPYARRKFPTRPLWGDQHLHTSWSFDAGFVCTLGVEEALKFARGEEVKSTYGVPAQLSRPLDWVVMTDHSDSMGFTSEIRAGNKALMTDDLLRQWNRVMNGDDFDAILSTAMDAIQRQGNGTLPGVATDPAFLQSVWDKYTGIIERYNEPGRFTAFIGYEWTPNPGPGNNMHRNVVYRDGKEVADKMAPFTTFESVDPEDLWAWMARYEETTGGKVHAIPHNGNLSNGLMFNTEKTYSGDELSREYAEMRMRFERLYEVTQIKGDGETHPSLSPDDEFADFETWDKGNLNLTPKKPDMIQYEYAREAYKNGLKLRQQLGVDPFKFGLVAGSDSHTALTAVEEDNFFGKHSGVEPSPNRWKHITLAFDGREILGWEMAAAGYTAVWATDNTRESIWDAMYRREAYATTGPRMTVRFFGGWEFNARDAAAREPGWIGYDKGVPMGANLEKRVPGKAPTFLVGALRDPIGGNLDRIQIIKGWVDSDGEARERVYDVAVSGDREIGADGRCRTAVGNTVDVAEATWSNDIGAPELITVWEDPDFDPAQPAFYYARVIQIPTPRWTAYDAKRFQVDMPEKVPMVIQERAYTSPIWYQPEE
jgi:hypothetical protein